MIASTRLKQVVGLVRLIDELRGLQFEKPGGGQCAVDTAGYVAGVAVGAVVGRALEGEHGHRPDGGGALGGPGCEVTRGIERQTCACFEGDTGGRSCVVVEQVEPVRGLDRY